MCSAFSALTPQRGLIILRSANVCEGKTDLLCPVSTNHSLWTPYPGDDVGLPAGALQALCIPGLRQTPCLIPPSTAQWKDCTPDPSQRGKILDSSTPLFRTSGQRPSVLYLASPNRTRDETCPQPGTSCKVLVAVGNQESYFVGPISKEPVIHLTPASLPDA